ncbi:hypothetical protein PF005_g9477 [Phytophthora fragariae]|uniref:Uncharacterized protein n=1 Tax=Phytophthora fragariae TaxID=53985 RepID=A0A6A3YBS4_9STRA|nr:hypothetical protein PF005_g9477 [Phytophthora fragariae]
MPRSRAARLRASRTPDDAELNVMQLAPAEPSPYVYVPSAPETSAYTFDKIMASVSGTTATSSKSTKLA